MNDLHQPEKEPLTDSPWFWLYLFATFALITLVFTSSKYERRQENIERQHHARETSNLIQLGHQPETIEAVDNGTTIGLVPIYIVLLLLVSVGWVRLWYTRFSPSSTANSSSLTQE